MYIPPNLTEAVFALARLVVGVYWRLRLTYPIHYTDRYIDFRPGDAFILIFLIIACVLVGIPVWLIVGWFTVLSLGAYLGVAFALFLLPPALTTGYMELRMLLKPSR